MQVYKDSEQFLISNPEKGSLQSRIFDTCKSSKQIKSNPKHIYALVSSTLKYKPFIQKIIKKTKLLQLEKKSKLTEPIALLLVHDLLFSKSHRIQSKQHPWKDAIIKNKSSLNAELARIKIKHGVKSLDDLIEKDDTPVRWFRTNLLKNTNSQLIKEFQHLKEVDSIEKIELGTIFYDPFIPNLFGIHPREKLTSTDAYKNGRIIIQDRASCFPAQILNPIPGKDKIIDACAAPGNKTTHLASILQNNPKSIIAFEKDNKRVKIIKMMCEKADGLKCISIQHGDFTTTRPKDYPEVTGMLVDPSCSGSGIFGRAFDEQDEIDEESAKEKLAERLARLSGFQYKIVKHALSFPNVKKVVYSTCSIHNEENEGVVKMLLEDDDVKQRGWTVSKKKNVLPDWPRRGNVEAFAGMNNKEELADGCIRTIPKVDGGIGFFAVCFERDQEDNLNENANENEKEQK